MEKIKAILTKLKQTFRRYTTNPIQDMLGSMRKEEMHSYVGRYCLVYEGHETFHLGSFGQIVDYNSLDNLYYVLGLDQATLPEHIDRDDPTTRLFWVRADQLSIIDTFVKPNKITTFRRTIGAIARLTYLALGASIGIGVYLEYLA